MLIQIWDKERMQVVDDSEYLMETAGLDKRMGYESVGVQDDGTPVVFDRCGNFGYLDHGKYRVIIGIEKA